MSITPIPKINNTLNFYDLVRYDGEFYIKIPINFELIIGEPEKCHYINAIRVRDYKKVYLEQTETLELYPWKEVTKLLCS
jgi:hypothetical protein